MFPRDIFEELDNLQRQFQRAFEIEPSIRGVARGGFPALNVGSTPQSVELYAFAPGLDPATIDVQIERGVLTISGERADDLRLEDGGSQQKEAAVHFNERFSGKFRRVVSLPDDIDPNAVTAQYRDGVLRISVKRMESVQPRRISVH
jgi:HSP20 family protein